MNRPAIGTRMTLLHEVWRYPHFAVPKGAAGTVVHSDEWCVALRMDEHIPGAEEWDNEVHWVPNNDDDVYADAELEMPRLVLHYGRRNVEVPVDLARVDLSRPIAQRSVAQKIGRCLLELSLPRGLVKPGSHEPERLPREERST